MREGIPDLADPGLEALGMSVEDLRHIHMAVPSGILDRVDAGIVDDEIRFLRIGEGDVWGGHRSRECAGARQEMPAIVHSDPH